MLTLLHTHATRPHNQMRMLDMLQLSLSTAPTSQSRACGSHTLDPHPGRQYYNQQSLSLQRPYSRHSSGGGSFPSQHAHRSPLPHPLHVPPSAMGPKVPRQAKASPLALNVSVVILTTCIAASVRLYGMDPQLTAPETLEATSSTPRIAPYAPAGNDHSAVKPSTPPPSSTNVQDAAALSTELRHALKCRRLSILTPYIPSMWEHWLSAAGLLDRYPSIVNGLCFSFAIGIVNPSISFTPPNNPSIKEHGTMFSEIVHKEYTKG